MNENQRTRRWCLRAIGGAVGGTAILGSASADEHIVREEAVLTDEAHGLDTGASGHATFEVNLEEGTVDYELHIDRICDPTQAHVHMGGPDEDGPVVVWLYPEDVQEPRHIEGLFQGTLATGTITSDDFVGPAEGMSFEEATAMFEEEGGLYVNVHTVEHPGGEIRGQIEPVEESPADDNGEDAPPDDDDEENLQEIEVELTGEGHGIETEASGLAVLRPDLEAEEVHYRLDVRNIYNVTMAHIHLGGPNEDGPVVVWLYPEEGMEPELIEGRFSGTLAEGTFSADDFVGPWEGLSLDEAHDQRVEQGGYVNVHTEEHPGGEIRGQITDDGGEEAPPEDDGEEEPPEDDDGDEEQPNDDDDGDDDYDDGDEGESSIVAHRLGFSRSDPTTHFGLHRF